MLVDDLAGRFVPAGVHLWGAPHGQADRPGGEGQRGQLDPVEVRSPAQPVPQLEHRCDVHGEELGDVRCGERAAHHRLGGHLPDALDRDPLLPGGRVVAGRGARRNTASGGSVGDGAVLDPGECFEIGPGDHPVGPGRMDGREVDTQVLGQLAHRRGGQRHAGELREGCRSRPGAGTGGGAVVRCWFGRGMGCRQRTAGERRRHGVDDRRGSRTGLLARPPGPGTGRRDVPDQGGRTAVRGHLTDLGADLGVGGRLRLGCLRRRPGDPAVLRHRTGVRLGVDDDDRGADVDGDPGLDQQGVHPAGVRRRQLDGCLRGLDLDHDLVDGQVVADPDLPLQDLGLGQALTHVRHGEFL